MAKDGNGRRPRASSPRVVIPRRRNKARRAAPRIARAPAPNTPIPLSRQERFWAGHLAHPDRHRPNVQLSKQEDFWRVYLPTRTRTPRRTQSLPPSFRATEPQPAARPSFFHRITKAYRKTSRFCRDNRRVILVSLGVVATTSYIIRNTLSWTYQAPSPLVAAYHHTLYPQWMHTDNAYTVLGMEPPLVPGWVPPLTEVRRALRNQAFWAPDKWMANGLPDRETAERIWDIYSEALARFTNYWANPWCAIEKHEDANLLQPISSSMPHFSNTCNEKCTLVRAATQALYAAVSPPSWHTQPPTTPAAAASYCPCSPRAVLRSIVASMKTTRIPPAGLPRYYQDNEALARSWNPLAWMVRAGGSSAIHGRPWEWTEGVKEGLGGWAVEDDFRWLPAACKLHMSGGEEQ